MSKFYAHGCVFVLFESFVVYIMFLFLSCLCLFVLFLFRAWLNVWSFSTSEQGSIGSFLRPCRRRFRGILCSFRPGYSDRSLATGDWEKNSSIYPKWVFWDNKLLCIKVPSQSAPEICMIRRNEIMVLLRWSLWLDVPVPGVHTDMFHVDSFPWLR